MGESGDQEIRELGNIDPKKPIYQFNTLFEGSLRKYFISKTKTHTSALLLSRFSKIPKLRLKNENWHHRIGFSHSKRMESYVVKNCTTPLAFQILRIISAPRISYFVSCFCNRIYYT